MKTHSKTKSPLFPVALNYKLTTNGTSDGCRPAGDVPNLYRFGMGEGITGTVYVPSAEFAGLALAEIGGNGYTASGEIAF